MVTLKQLATQLNISISTVSKALHDSPEISPQTINRVKELAKHLNYKPNKTALSLKNSKTKSIGVIVPNILNHFFAKVLYAIEKEASKQGYDIIICISNEKLKKELKSLEILANGSVDGFIISISEETQVKNKFDHFNTILNQKLPIVMFDRVAENVNCDKVIIDDIGAIYNATNYLISEGRRHIALISNIEELSVGKLRTNGYLKAIKDSKKYKNEPLILNISKTENLENSIENLLKNNKSIDAVISIDNITGVIALNKALKLGKNIPKDLSVVGFSDENVLHFTDPKLSTISQQTLEIGKKSVQTLIKSIESNTMTSNTKRIKTKLVLRNTTI